MYDRNVNGKVLTFCVSGSLWNRSLLMMDTQTESLWSHILGAAVQGSQKDAELKTIPADMVTWEEWQRRHPQTTVLNLGRTSRNYTKEFYRQPKGFVVGFNGAKAPRHCAFETLSQQPLVNVEDADPLLLLYSPGSTSARLYSRRVGDRVLTFEVTGDKQLRDRETGSTWDRDKAVATAGQLRGERLESRVGIVSFAHAWMTFHPDSVEVVHEQVGPATDPSIRPLRRRRR